MVSKGSGTCQAAGTYQQGTLSSELSLQTIWVCLGGADLVRVNLVHGKTQAQDCDDKGSEQDAAPCGVEVVVVVQRDGAEDVVVLVAGLAIVAAVLLVPPVGVGVAVVALLEGRVDVAAVLVGVGKLSALVCGEGCAALGEVRDGRGAQDGAGERTGRCDAPGEHAGRVSAAVRVQLGRFGTLRQGRGGVARGDVESLVDVRFAMELSGHGLALAAMCR